LTLQVLITLDHTQLTHTMTLRRTNSSEGSKQLHVIADSVRNLLLS